MNTWNFLYASTLVVRTGHVYRERQVFDCPQAYMLSLRLQDTLRAISQGHYLRSGKFVGDPLVTHN